MDKFPRIIVFVVLGILLVGNVHLNDKAKPVAESNAAGFVAGQSGKSMANSDLIQGKGKVSDYQEQIKQEKTFASFNDTAGHWAEASISLIKSIGLCKGFPDGSFRPDLSLTQLEAISLLMQLTDMTDENQSIQISDEKVAMIPVWGQPAVKKAVMMGVIDLDEFDSTQPVSRAVLFKWLVKTKGLESSQVQQLPFADANSFSAELNGYIMPLYQQGLVRGYPDGKLHPELAVSRAEMMIILVHLMDEKDTIRLNIFSVNDFHGSLVESGDNPGAAKLAAYLKDSKAQNPEGTLILSGGDMMQGSADSNLLNGEPVIEVMNKIGFDAMAFGNHEFDWGVDTLQARAKQASFPFLSCNVKDKKTGQALPFTQPYIMTEKAGVKIGIIGFTTPETAYKVLPSIISTYEISDPTAIVNSLASELRQKGAQIIIVVGHSGAYPSSEDGTLQGEAAEIAKSLQGVDVLVTAHTHQKYAQTVNGIAVVQADCNGRSVAEVALNYPPIEKKVRVSKLDVVDIKGLNLSEDASVKAIIEAGNEKIGPIKDRVIGRNCRDLPFDKTELSPLGQWFTDSLRQAANADIVFINGGAFKSDIPAGDITVGKLWEVLPFENTLCTVNMTGAQVIQVLNYGIKNEQYGMVQYSGLRIQYNGSLEPDQRIVKVTLTDGAPLQPDKTYRVAINDFLAEGGDGFTMFKQFPDLTNTQESIREMIINYIEKVQSIDFTADDRFQE